MARTFTALGLGGSRGVSAPLRAAAAGDRIISLLSLQRRVTQLCNKLEFLALFVAVVNIPIKIKFKLWGSVRYKETLEYAFNNLQ